MQWFKQVGKYLTSQNTQKNNIVLQRNYTSSTMQTNSEIEFKDNFYYY